MNGNDLRRIRREMRLTQRQLGSVLQLSRRTIMRRERLGEAELPMAEATTIELLYEAWKQERSSNMQRQGIAADADNP